MSFLQGYIIATMGLLLVILMLTPFFLAVIFEDAWFFLGLMISIPVVYGILWRLT